MKYNREIENNFVWDQHDDIDLDDLGDKESSNKQCITCRLQNSRSRYDTAKSC